MGASDERQFGGLNVGYVAELIERYATDPGSVPAADRMLLANGHEPPAAASGQLKAAQPAPASSAPPVAKSTILDLRRLQTVVNSIRDYGYRAANLDPLGLHKNGKPSVADTTGVSPAVLAAPASSLIDLLGEDNPYALGATAGELIETLRQTYCGNVGYEFSHVRDVEERTWLQHAVEAGVYRPFITNDQKKSLLNLLTRAETFEAFLHRTFPGQRWYSLEGVEALIPLLDQLILQSAYSGIAHVVVGMAHRGRLNVLAHIFGKPYKEILGEFTEGHFQHLASLEAAGWMTDVKYHMGARIFRDVNGDGATDITLTLIPNPSHLELIDPVVVGGVRALQDRAANGSAESEAMGIMVHGDAAFAGQGIIAETLNMFGLSGYRTGGTVHVIVNNQIGFTTEPEDGYSTEHASDIARGYDIPIVHVNADDVEACISVAKLAIAYRQRFGKDFLIDLVGYRRYGHNENDEPSFTQPIMYRKIKDHPTVRAIYADRLAQSGVVPTDESAKMVDDLMTDLQGTQDEIASSAGEGPKAPPDLGLSAHGSSGLEHEKTAVSASRLRKINEALTEAPSGFTLHPTASRILARRREVFTDEGRLDWAHAEALAFGSVLMEGTPVRLTGQDTERGTFSQRHAVFHDYETAETWVPLKGLDGASFSVFNSPLSEIAAVGFEHGYSVFAPEALVLWEAQFGDFVNNAQAIVDELIVSARAKWNQKAGLVLLLPHGYEGQGPNHSHAHLERFLALAARDNIRVAYPTTAGQYFHLLRSQAATLKDEPLPLIVMTAKSLLRHPLASARVSDLTTGSFEPVICYERDGVEPATAKRLVLCTGKVFVDLVSSPAFEKAEGVSIIRFEELYPFPKANLAAELSRYKKLQQVVWLQEEPKNRGAWAFISPLLEEVLGPGQHIEYVGRPATPSPAEGANWLHKLQQNHLIELALGVA